MKENEIKLPPCVSCSRAMRDKDGNVICCIIPESKLERQFQRVVLAAINGECQQYRQMDAPRRPRNSPNFDIDASA